jgi:hypothetical protein
MRDQTALYHLRHCVEADKKQREEIRGDGAT